MSDDLLITPGSRKQEFKDSSGNVDAKIETDSSGNLIITNPGGDISIGDTTADIFVGDGTNSVDIVFEQPGEIRGTTGVTLTLGQSDSSVRMATDLNLNSNDLTNVATITTTGNATVGGNLTISGNLTVSGSSTTLNTATLDVEDKNITLNKGSGDTSGSANGAGITIQDAVNSSTDATILWDATNDEFDFSHSIKVAGSIGVTNIVTNKVVKYNGSTLDDSNITDTGSLITLGSATTISSGDLTIPANLKATGNNLKFFAGGTHVLNIDLNRKIYPQTDASTDLGFNTSTARFRHAYLSGQVNAGSVVATGSLALDPDTGNNVTISADGTYGTSGSGRYVTIGFGGTSNGSNRVFAHNTGADGLYLAAATGRGVAIRTNGSGSNTYFFGSGGEMQRNGGNIISSTGTFIGTTGFSSDTSQTGRMYSWKPVHNTSSSGSVYIKIATLTINQSARFSIELIGRSTSYGDGNFPSYGKLVGQLNNDNNVDCVFYDFKSGMNGDGSNIVTNIFTKYISNTSHEVWVNVGDFSELGAFAYVSTGSITPHTSNTGSTTSQPSGLTTITKLEMWNNNNDGSGSGLDADTLDGISSEHFLRSNVSDTYSGTLTLDTNSQIRLPNSSSYGIRSSSGHRVLDSLDGTLRIGDTAKHSVIRLHGQGSDDFRVYYGATDYQIFHEGNDGSGSGLDADTVDGIQASALTKTTATTTQNMNNFDITGVNRLTFNDPGVTEGLKWAGGNQWQIYESGNDQTNTSGNLQFTSGSGNGTRRMTLTTGGVASNLLGSAAYSRPLLEITNGGTPTQIKITTNIPYSGSGASTHAHSVTIRGFQYGNAQMADLQIGWHVYNNQFYNRSVTSSGSWAPVVTLAVENNKVVIHLASPGYWPKMYVESMWNPYGGTNHAEGWSWSDAAISADSNTPNQTVPYKTNFGASASVKVGTHNVWHAGNDGSGSGLDADLLDGQQGSHYLNYNNFTNTPTVPTNNNQLTNGAGYITSSAITGKVDIGSGFADNRVLTAANSDTAQGESNLTFNGSTLTVTGDIVISDSTPLLKLTDTSNAGGGAAEGKILLSNTAGDAMGVGYTSNIQTNSDFLISSDAGGTFGGHLGLDSGAISDARSHIILEPKTNLMLANGGTNGGAVFQIGLPGNGTNVNGCFFSIEGNTDTSGEGSGRLMFREHNSSTASADNYGVSFGYRGGSTSVTTAMGNTWTGLSNISNGQWGMWGHDGSTTGALIMYGDRAATYVNFDSNDIRNVEQIEIADKVFHEGDTDTYMQFSAANVWRVVTAGTQAFKATATTLEVQRGLIAESDLQVGTTSTGRDVQIFMDGGAVTADNSGLTFTMAGTYSDGRYEHRFRKRDEGGGIPLYIDKTSGTANDHTQIVRFGSYTSNSDEFEVYGTMSSDGYRINNTSVINSSRALQNITGYTQTSGNASIEHSSSPTFELKDTTNNVTFKAYAQDSNAFVGTTSNHTLNIGTNNSSVLSISGSASTFTGDVQASGLYVGSTNTSFDFYNNGTSYLNGTTTIDAAVTVNGNMDFSSTDTATRYIHMPRGGGITFYGDTSTHHAILSRDQAGNAADDLTISSYGALYIDLDSNNNNTSGSDFFIGRHGASSGTDSALFVVRSETGNILQNGLTTMSQSSGTLTVGDVSGNDEITTVDVKAYGGNGRVQIGDAEIFFNGTGNSSAKFKMASTTFHSKGDIIAFSSTLNSSDIRLKDNVRSIESPLDKVLSIDGIVFDWKDKERGINNLGFIAQDIEKVLPEVVQDVEDGLGDLESYKAVNYSGVVPLLVEAIKEQQTIINRLEERLNNLENKGEE